MRSASLDPASAAAGGRIFNAAGDGLLAEFASAADAVVCAIKIQAAAPALPFRIAVNLGDVLSDEGDVFGDGVNVAARLQELAEPGGVGISGAVHDIAAVRALASFADGGELRLKNIEQLVRVWRWVAQATPIESKPLSLPDKPSIVVLAFQNMSGDPNQEFFADGVTEDITSALSWLRWLFVIARNSAFTYKDRAISMRKIPAEMGVRYVLQGSVRKAANRIRITAQLIDTETAAHLWAEKYDRDLADIFEVQDEITSSILAAIEPQLAGAERERAVRRRLAHGSSVSRNLAFLQVHRRRREEGGTAISSCCDDERLPLRDGPRGPRLLPLLD